MLIRLLSASALAILAASAYAAPVMMTASPTPDKAPAGVFNKADEALEAANRELANLQDCEKVTASLRADYVNKQRELKAEFRTIPPAFNAILLKKRKRLDKQEQSCLDLVKQPGLLFERAHELLRQIEPKNTPGVAERFKRVEAGRARYNKIIAPKGNP